MLRTTCSLPALLQDAHSRIVCQRVLPYLREALPSEVTAPLRKVEKCAVLRNTRVKAVQTSFEDLESSLQGGKAVYYFRLLKSNVDVLQSTVVVELQVEVELALFVLRKHTSEQKWLARDEMGLAFPSEKTTSNPGSWRRLCFGSRFDCCN